jgi:hypothetical protein
MKVIIQGTKNFVLESYLYGFIFRNYERKCELKRTIFSSDTDSGHAIFIANIPPKVYIRFSGKSQIVSQINIPLQACITVASIKHHQQTISSA